MTDAGTTQTPAGYLDSLFAPDAQLEQIREAIRSSGMPEISVPAGYGRLLTLLVSLSRAEQVLEIGALGGYSGVCLARGMAPGGRLVSLELRQEYADLAAQQLALAGYGGQVEYRVGEALHSLEALEQEGRQFDFFFIDADKPNYPRYLEFTLKLARPGALIVGDNILMKGKAMNPQEKGNSVSRMREFTERMAGDPRLEGVLLPAYDGLAIARVRA